MILRLTIKRLLSKKFSTIFTILALSLALTIFFTFKMSLENYKNNLSAASDKNILIAGRTPDLMQLIENSHFFKNGESSTFPIIMIEELEEFGEIIPLNNRFTAYQKPIIGIESKYFDLKKVKLQTGDYFLKVGECVIGFNCAKELNLSVGDSFINDPSSSFDISKSNPVKLKVCGILANNGTPDDNAIFTSLKTAWVLEGIGHSHNPKEKDDTDSSITDLSSGPLLNLHFHGKAEKYPLTGVIIFPDNDVKRAQLLAKSKNNKTTLKIVDPVAMIHKIIEKISGLDSFFKLLFLFMSLAIVIVLGVLIFQAASLRSREKDTYQCLGIPKSFFYKSIICEWTIFISLSLLIGLLSSIFIKGFALDLFSILI